MTLNDVEYEKLLFWADKKNVSINEYLHMCFDHMIDYENGVYDAPTIVQERMNLVVDALTMNSSKLDSLAEFITGGFESLLAAARGDDYIHTEQDDITDDDDNADNADDAFDFK